MNNENRVYFMIPFPITGEWMGGTDNEMASEGFHTTDWKVEEGFDNQSGSLVLEDEGLFDYFKNYWEKNEDVVVFDSIEDLEKMRKDCGI